MELVSVSFQLKQIVNRGTHYLIKICTFWSHVLRLLGFIIIIHFTDRAFL